MFFKYNEEKPCAELLTLIKKKPSANFSPIKFETLCITDLVATVPGGLFEYTLMLQSRISSF